MAKSNIATAINDAHERVEAVAAGLVSGQVKLDNFRMKALDAFHEKRQVGS